MAPQNGARSDNISIVLVRPQLGENIGAAARAMLNFGISKLKIVSPRDPWPNTAAEATSAGAISVIKNAEIFDDIESAISGDNVVYAATARPRDMHKITISPREINLETSFVKNNKVSILFGPERSGLSNQEVAYAQKIITIPVNQEMSSINLSQSVGIICYEIFSQIRATPLVELNVDQPTQEQYSHFFSTLECALEQSNFFKVDNKKNIMMLNIRNIFNRISDVSKQDINTLHGIIKSLNSKR